MRYFVLSMVLLCLCITSAMAQDETAADNDWWQDTVWYEIFIRSFYDSDGDGIGDIQGIIEKLDYLNDGDPTTTDDLGITGIWLMPVMESVSYHGYDTTDYMAVEQDYGTEEDFQQLMDEAHKRGIRVIVDFVVNHTATEHPWFEAAADHDPRYRDYYLWARENPNEPGPWGDVAWHPLEDDYYYGVFWSGMPDLNYNNPDVLSEIQDAARFWLEDMGVDGFRLDAIRYVLEETINDRRILADSPGNRALLTDFNALVAEINPEALTIGEILTSTLIIERYIEEDAVDIAFEFELADDYLAAAGRGRKRDLERKMEDMGEVYPGYAYASFLTNHDEPRVMTELSGNIDDAKIAASLLLLSPGTPFIYYGEEIGMRGTKPDEHIRTPMQWDTTLVTGGFTSAAEAWQPLTEGFENFTVSGQDDDPDSLLNHYRGLVQFRNAHPAIRRGDFLPVDTSYRGLYSFIRRTDDETLLIVINLDDDPLSEYTLAFDEGVLNPVETAALLMGEGDVIAPQIADDGSFEDYTPIPGELAPQTVYVIQLD